MPVHNQAEASTYFKDKKEELFKKAEVELHEVLVWADHPVTRQIMKLFENYQRKTIKKLKGNQWTEAEGRGMCYALEYFDILPDFVEYCRKTLNAMQLKKEREK